MRKRTVFTSVAMAVAAVVGSVASTPLASADEPVTTAASWDCTPTYDHEDPAGLIVACSYGGRYRGSASFWWNSEPEHLAANDGAADHRAVRAELTWTQNGQSRLSTIRSAGPYVSKDVSVREDSRVLLRLCLEGHSCGPRYPAYA